MKGLSRRSLDKATYAVGCELSGELIAFFATYRDAFDYVATKEEELHARGRVCTYEMLRLYDVEGKTAEELLHL